MWFLPDWLIAIYWGVWISMDGSIGDEWLMDGWKVQMDGQADECMDGLMDEWMKVDAWLIHRWMDRLRDNGWTDGQADGGMDRQMEGQMDGWMDWLIDGWISGKSCIAADWLINWCIACLLHWLIDWLIDYYRVMWQCILESTWLSLKFWERVPPSYYR